MKTFPQGNPANPVMNSERFSLLSDGSFWLTTMTERRASYSPDVLGDLRIYRMDLTGALLDSVDILGKAVVQQMSSFGTQTFLLLGIMDSVVVDGQAFGYGANFHQMVLHLNSTGAVNLVFDAPDTLNALVAIANDSFLVLSNDNFTEPHIALYNDTGNQLQVRAIPGAGRPYAISHNPNGSIVISGSCLNPNFAFDAITLSSSTIYNAYVLNLNANFQGVWGNVIEDITCQFITHRQGGNGEVLVGGSTTQALSFGSQSHAGPNSSNSDFYLASMNAQGVYQWVQEIPSDTGWSRAMLAAELPMAYDQNGNVYMIGTVNSSVNWGGGQMTASASGETDCFVISYDQNGNLRWVKNFALGGRGIPSQIESLGVDHLLISGIAIDTCWFDSMSVPMTFGEEFITLLVPDVVLGMEENGLNFNIFPNPSQNGWLSIESDSKLHQVEAFDLAGKQIAAWKNPDGTNFMRSEISEKGIFSLLVQSENGVTRHKIVVQ